MWPVIVSVVVAAAVIVMIGGDLERLAAVTKSLEKRIEDLEQ